MDVDKPECYQLLPDNSETEVMQLQEQVHKTEVKKLQEQVQTLTERNVDLEQEVKHLEHLLEQYEHVSGKILTKQSEVIKLYKEIADTGKLLGGILSISERNEIKFELKRAQEIFNLNLRQSREVVDILEHLEPMLFANILTSLREDCPTIINVLEQIVLSSNSYRNVKKTENMKMKASIHLLSSLMDIRDQNAKNDIQVLFGLLCISYGARSSLISILQQLGLCESFPTL